MTVYERPEPNRWRPSEEELAAIDPIDVITEGMKDRGFESLWTARPPQWPDGVKPTRITFDDKGKLLYLRKLALTGRHAFSAAHAGVSRYTVNTHKRQDPVFAQAVEEALSYFRDLLAGEMYRRGVEGFEEGVVGGKNRDQIIMVPKYSDRMLELLGRIHFKDLNTKATTSTTVIDNSQTNVVASTLDLENMPPEDLAMFKTLVENQAARLESTKKDDDAIEGEIVKDVDK